MSHAGVRTEKPGFNFTPDRVHWVSCAGRNFTDRQRISRRAANWGKNYRVLPRAEHLAVLAAMMAVEAGSLVQYEMSLNVGRISSMR